MYSLSAELSATTDCRFEYQLIAAPASLSTQPEVDLRLSLHQRDELVELAAHRIEPHEHLGVGKLQRFTRGRWGGERVPLTASNAGLL